jgi:21S rRNA (GM2251-2'-O)-methyltransferase
MLSAWKRTLYLDIYSIVASHSGYGSRRNASTTSAIKAGLRATRRDSPAESKRWAGKREDRDARRPERRFDEREDGDARRPGRWSEKREEVNSRAPRPDWKVRVANRTGDRTGDRTDSQWRSRPTNVVADMTQNNRERESDAQKADPDADEHEVFEYNSNRTPREEKPALEEAADTISEENPPPPGPEAQLETRIKGHLESVQKALLELPSMPWSPERKFKMKHIKNRLWRMTELVRKGPTHMDKMVVEEIVIKSFDEAFVGPYKQLYLSNPNAEPEVPEPVIGRKADGSFKLILPPSDVEVKGKKAVLEESGSKTPQASSPSSSNPDREAKKNSPKDDEESGRKNKKRDSDSNSESQGLIRYSNEIPVSNQKTNKRQPPPKPVKGNEQEEEDLDEDEDEDDHPISIPYTTAASEFLYGTNAVLACLRAQRRKGLHRLHLSERAFYRSEAAHTILSLAHHARIPITQHNSPRLLDAIAKGRVHNGVVLEASPLPFPPVRGLYEPHENSGRIHLALHEQDQDQKFVNGTPKDIPTSVPATSWRRPFVLLLDGITDPGNLGNILRTAYFYGVDAVAIATNTCAPISSPVVAKAASGSLEALNLLAVPTPANFVRNSRGCGWQIHAAVAPAAPGTRRLAPSTSAPQRRHTTRTIASSTPLVRDPVLLMLGAEGEGLRENLVSKADVLVSISPMSDEGGGHAHPLSRGRVYHTKEPRRAVDVGVDSLNVGVAAGVLVDAFLSRPKAKGWEGLKGNSRESSRESSREKLREKRRPGPGASRGRDRGEGEGGGERARKGGQEREDEESGGRMF